MYLTRIRWAAAVIVLAVAGAPMLAAQERPTEFETHLAPGLTFTPGVTLAGVWDSNVGVADTLGAPESSKLFIVEPFGQLELVSPRTELVLGYKGYIRRYPDVSELNGFDQRGYLSLRRMATRRLTFFARNEYADVPSTDEVELNGLPFSRTGSKSNRLNAGIEARLAKYTDLTVRYENTWVKFDRPATFLSNGWINSLQADVRRRLSERLSVGGEYQIRRADPAGGERTIWFHDLGTVVAYAAGAHTKLVVSGGYSFLRDSRLDRDRQGPYLRGDLQHELERASIGLSYEKSFVPSFGFGGSSDSQEVRGFIHMPFSRSRIYVQSVGAWRRTDPLLAEELHLDTIQTNNTIGYAIARSFRVEAFHVFTRQDSRITGGEVNRQRAGAQIVVSQPMRIR